MKSVVDETGMQSLDTSIAIRAGGDGSGGYDFEGERMVLVLPIQLKPTLMQSTVQWKII